MTDSHCRNPSREPPKVLRVDASTSGEGFVTRRVAESLVERLEDGHGPWR